LNQLLFKFLFDFINVKFLNIAWFNLLFNQTNHRISFLKHQLNFITSLFNSKYNNQIQLNFIFECFIISEFPLI
jgi:hypothetical protein